jgi:ketosteroid isomerase-like protein
MARERTDMSDKNKTLLQQANAAVVEGDNEGFLVHCTDDVIWNFIGEQTLNGKEAVRRYMAETYLEPPKFVVDELIANDDFVTAIGTIDVRDAGGKTVPAQYCDVWRVRDGKLAELRAFVIPTSK